MTRCKSCTSTHNRDNLLQCLPAGLSQYFVCYDREPRSRDAPEYGVCVPKSPRRLGELPATGRYYRGGLVTVIYKAQRKLIDVDLSLIHI